MSNIEEEIKLLKERNNQLIKNFQKTCLHELTFRKHINEYRIDTNYLICKNCNKIICYNHGYNFFDCQHKCQK